MQPINYLAAMPQIDLGASLFNGLRAGQGIQESRQLREMRDIQIQQANAEQEQADSFRTDIDKLLADPTPEGYAAMFARYPSFQKALSASWETRDKAAKETDLRELSGIYAAGQSGRWDVAASSLKRRIEADRAAGQDTTEDEEALRIAENGTPEEKRALLGMTGVQLAATLGPDKFTDAYKELNPNQQREGKVVGDYLVDPVTGEVRFQAPTDPKYMNIDGNLVEIPGAPGMQGGDDVFERMIQQESGGQQFGADGKPLRSPKGAVGIAQVMPKTGPEAAQLAGLPWDVKRFHTDPEYNAALGKAYYQKLLSDFEDPALAAAAYNAGPKRVQDALRKGGANGWINHVPEETRNYVSNVIPARSGGAPKVLFSSPDRNAARMSPEEVAAEGLDPKTVYYRNKDGIPQAVSGQTGRTFKQVPDSTAKRVTTNVEVRESLQRALSGFRDDFGGNAVTGGIENELQAIFNVGTPGQREWWADFKSTDNQIRNDLFGSALTATEKAAYEATTISPRMDPKTIRANLEKRFNIVSKALARQQNFLKKNKYDPEAVDALFQTDALGGSMDMGAAAGLPPGWSVRVKK